MEETKKISYQNTTDFFIVKIFLLSLKNYKKRLT
jgi:hypothetical protein